jgi:hypothetical protein
MSTTHEPYDNPETPANQQARNEGLSTADMAAAANRQTANDQMRRSSELAKEAVRADAASSPRPAGTPADNAAKPAALLTPDQTNSFRSRWGSIQTGFVDQPRKSVEQADALVAEVMKQLAQTFADERSKLENAWGRGDNVSTEDLRIALQRYRSFFDRLLSV